MSLIIEISIFVNVISILFAVVHTISKTRYLSPLVGLSYFIMRLPEKHCVLLSAFNESTSFVGKTAVPSGQVKRNLCVWVESSVDKSMLQLIVKQISFNGSK